MRMRAIAVGEFADRAEKIGDGAASGGEDSGDGQEEESLIGGVEEDGAELIEQGASEGWYKKHGDPLVPGSWAVW